jgi:DNA-binding response OmpR family regulator
MMKSAGMSILVVEDEKLMNWSLAKSLAKWGFDVLPVFTGNEAMAQLEKSGFDAILLDYQLPDMDGLQVARRVRKAQPRAVIFLVTAFELSDLALEAGLIDAYFNKPLDFEQLHRALANLPGWSSELKEIGGTQSLP